MSKKLSKKVIKRVRCGLRLLKNKRQAIARQLRKDLAELIQSSHEEIAFNRYEYREMVFHEQSCTVVGTVTVL
ncbi:hypothetical protein GmHk_01G001414 [Glycine max]|nr:hypothetical protein GmHk_01G001414 [Glycine max]